MSGLIPVLAIVGPTAVGKSAVALEVAEALGGEIVSADSMQVYRGMDRGTSKPSPEQRRRVRHHMIDVREPGEYFSAGDFAREAASCVEDIHSRGKRVLVVGGSGLYVRALLRGLAPDVRDAALRRRLRDEAARLGPEALHERLRRVDPQSAARISPRDALRICRALEIVELTGRPVSEAHAQTQPPPYDVLMVGLTRPRPELYARIDARVDRFVEDGLFEEVAGLLEAGADPSWPSMQALGYKEVVGHLRGEYDRAEAIRLLKRNTRRYAKRQMTWFRKEPGIVWLDLSAEADPVGWILRAAGRMGG